MRKLSENFPPLKKGGNSGDWHGSLMDPWPTMFILVETRRALIICKYFLPQRPKMPSNHLRPYYSMDYLQWSLQ